MDLAIAQINSKLGDVDHNASKIIRDCRLASEAKKNLIIFPELCLIGYSPNDLLERPELLKKQNKFLKKIVKSVSKDLSVLVGCLNKEKGRLYNSTALIQKNSIVKFFNKELLPNYDVFDENRHFSKGNLNQNFFSLKGKKILVAICEDLWFDEISKYEKNPLKNLSKKPDHIISLNASPFSKGKQAKRERIIKKIATDLKCDITYVNICGAQDELIFDGQSFQMSKKGSLITRLPAFTEKLWLGEKIKTSKLSKYASLEKALVLGVKDYFQKTGFSKAHLGLSGGIDSALVLYLAVKALGSNNVTAIAMPGPYSSKLSLTLAQKLSKNLEVNFIEHDINKAYDTFNQSFESDFGKQKFGVVQENVQARLRGLSLMAFSNKENSLLLATSNKSELCVGYSTLYGDQCGALMPIGDLLKTEVFELCEWINRGQEVIPTKIITRPPTAELRPNQKDSDSLPSYDKLDKSIEKIITNQKAATSELDKWVLNRSFTSEFKRWQSAPILRVSDHAFGRGRRMPLAHRLKS